MGVATRNGQKLLWNFKVELQAGANSVSLGERTATPIL
jgi:hypothetical protein